MLILMMVNLYTSRVVLNALGVDDYGLYSIVGGVVIFLGFINTSMASASQRFLAFTHGKGDKFEINSVFNSVFIVHVIIGVWALVIGEVGGIFYINNYLNIPNGKFFDAHVVYQISLLSFVVKTITVPYTASIIANEKMDAFAIFSLVEGGLQLIAAIVIQYLNTNRLIWYSLLIFMSIVIVQLCYRIYSHVKFEECRIKKSWKRKTIREIFAYSGWNLFGALSSVAIDQGVNMILNSFFGVVVNAARGIAFQVSAAVSALSGNLQSAINPQIIKNYASNDIIKMHRLIIIGTRSCYLLLLILVLPVVFNINPILVCWLKIVPTYTSEFCILVLINSLISTWSVFLLTGVMATGIIKRYQIIVSAITISNIPICIILLRLYPNPIISVWCMIIINIIAFIARLYLSSNLINLVKSTFLKDAIIPCLKTTIIAVIICWITCMNFIPNDSNTFIGVALRCFVILIESLIIVYFIGMNRNERLILNNFISTKLKSTK